MRLLIVALVIACLPAFPQLLTEQPADRDEAIRGIVQTMFAEMAEHLVSMHQPIHLPSLGPKTSITASSFKGHEGNVQRQ
jgi:hypothetical protein